MKRFEGSTVLVTGGTSGMGLAAAQRFLDEGARVAISGRSESRLDAARAKLNSSEPEAVLTVVGDSADLEAIEVAMDLIGERFGRLDVLFANAGVGHFAAIQDISEADFDATVAVDFKGVFFTIQKALPLMPDDSAIVINASWTLYRGMTTCSLYSAAKAAVHNLSRTLAKELAERRIRVNSVSPGYINTGQFNEDDLDHDEARRRRSQVALARFGEPDEIAAAVAFLASADASYVNGQDLIIDGGMIATSA